MEEQKVMLINAVPAVRELRQVQGFDPLKFLQKGSGGKPKLELRYKRLWFRLACPNGRMLLKALRITDQMAIYEAQVFMSRDEELPVSNFTATVLEKDAPGGGYIKAAQDEALDVALDNAGFGIQLCDANVEHDAAPAVRHDPSRESAEGTEAVAENVRSVKTNPSEKPVVAVEPTPAAETRTDATPPQALVATSEELPGSSRAEKNTVQQDSAQVTAKTEAASTAAGVASLLKTITGGVSDIPAETEAAAEEAQSNDASTVGQALFTETMSVKEICSVMSPEEAGKVIVPFGFCKGWTLSQVADQRPASLKWLAHGCDNGGNILKAAALVLYETAQRMAG